MPASAPLFPHIVGSAVEQRPLLTGKGSALNSAPPCAPDHRKDSWRLYRHAASAVPAASDTFHFDESWEMLGFVLDEMVAMLGADESSSEECYSSTAKDKGTTGSVFCIHGPTGVGKTQLAFKLAKRLASCTVFDVSTGAFNQRVKMLKDLQNGNDHLQRSFAHVLGKECGLQSTKDHVIVLFDEVDVHDDAELVAALSAFVRQLPVNHIALLTCDCKQTACSF